MILSSRSSSGAAVRIVQYDLHNVLCNVLDVCSVHRAVDATV